MPHLHRARALAPLVLVAALVWPAPADAEPAKCRAAIVKQLAKYTRSAYTMVQRCEDTVLAGKLPSGTECRFEATTAAKIVAAGAKLAPVLAAKCGGKNKRCDAADGGDAVDDPLAALGWASRSCPAAGCTGAIASCAEVADCLTCASDTAISTAATLPYAQRAPATTPPDKTVRKCQHALGKETGKLFVAASKLRERCWTLANAGKPGFTAPCPGGDTSGATLAKLAAARAGAAERICQACGGRDKRCGTADDLALAAITTSGACPELTVPGGAACGREIATLTDLAACMTCVAEFHAACLGSLGAPWGEAYPAACAEAAGAGLEAMPGDPQATLASAVFDFTPGVGFTAAEVTVDPQGAAVVRTRLGVGFAIGATVAQANAVLAGTGGDIISMLAGVPYLLLRVPDPGGLDALDALVAAVEAMPGVAGVTREGVAELQELPAKYPRTPGSDVTDAPGLSLLKHLIAARVPAMWNAAPPVITAPTQKPPTLILTDAFGFGSPDAKFAVAPVFPRDFASGKPRNHGYQVLGMAVASLSGQAPNCLTDGASVDRRPCSVGLYPSVQSLAVTTLRLRAVDIGPAGEKQLSVQEIEDDLIIKLGSERKHATTAGFPTGGVIVNTSLNSSVIAGDPVEAGKHARRWIAKLTGRNLTDAFLHVSAAGNVLAAQPGITGAPTASAVNAAALLDGVEHLGNILVIENRTVGPYPFVPGALSPQSKVGGHLSAVATDVWTVDGANDGTSLAAPQVAGLAAFLWQLRPALTTAELRDLLIASARPVADGAPVIDAYAAALAADASFTDAPVRRRLLDVRGDDVFNAADVERFFADWEKAGSPAGRLYSRVDLRGARGAEDVAFDLDLNRQIGVTAVLVETRNTTPWFATFNETNLEHDEEIVCYYAFTTLYAKSSDPVDAGQERCCKWLRDHGRLPADAPCFGCPPRGRALDDPSCPAGDTPSGSWVLRCGDGTGFQPGFTLLEDGTMMESAGALWEKTGTWSTAGSAITIEYCPVAPFSGRGTFHFEGEWSPVPVPAEFGVVTCNPVHPNPDCPALKGTLTQFRSDGTMFGTPRQCDSRFVGASRGWAPFQDPRDQVCHGGCFEVWDSHWPHLCAPGDIPCGRSKTVCVTDPELPDSCPDGLVCRSVISNGFCRCVEPVEQTCTVTADCPPDMTCCPGGADCGVGPWQRQLCIHDPGDAPQ